MKLKKALPVLASLVIAGHVLGQGQVIFRNTPTTAVIDGRTGSPVAQGVGMVGLYFTTDLNALPILFAPADAFTLAAVAPITPNPLFPGVYSAGFITIPGVAEGEEVLLQVRGWTGQQYGSYAEAMESDDALLGVSNLMQFRLGGSTTLIPIPNISVLVEGFTLSGPITNVPEPSTYVLCLLGGLGILSALRRGPPRRDPARPGPLFVAAWS